jgi:hypothetical protein
VSIFPTDIPLDSTGTNADRWHFQLSEPFNGHHAGALLDNGRTVEPVMARTLRRIAGGMGSMLVGAIRVEGGDVLELGDCSTLRHLAPGAAPEPALVPVTAPPKLDPEAAAWAALEAEVAAEEAAKGFPPAAVPASVPAAPTAGAAAHSTPDTEPATPSAKLKSKHGK